MPTSQNGWSANDRTLITSRRVPSTDVRLAVRTGPAGDLLIHFATRFNREVENISTGRGAPDDWGYAERPIRGGWELSNHASGTAIDLNALRHPLARRGTFTPEQVQVIHTLLRDYHGCLRWGGDYDGRVDEMHIEIDAGPAAVARVAASLHPLTDDEDDMKLDDKLTYVDVNGQQHETTVGRALGVIMAQLSNDHDKTASVNGNVKKLIAR